jgi:hypothetical protein
MGFRAGSGRVPKCQKPVRLEGPFSSAIEYLMSLLNHPDVPIDLKARAAISLLPFQTPRADEVGKKGRALERAEAVAASAGAFAVPATPRKPN